MSSARIHPLAQAEYQAAVRWYADRSIVAAKQFVVEVRRAISEIEHQPERFAKVDKTHRICLVSKYPYYVAFRQNKDSVEIVAIRHASRDQDTWKIR